MENTPRCGNPGGTLVESGDLGSLEVGNEPNRG